jgi:hypothetical protein
MGVSPPSVELLLFIRCMGKASGVSCITKQQNTRFQSQRTFSNSHGENSLLSFGQDSKLQLLVCRDIFEQAEIN